MNFEVIASGVGFTEGPVFTQDGRIVFTSIDQGKVYQVENGETSVLALTGGGPNGATEGADGTIYIAQNGGRFPAHRWPGITGGVQAIHPGGRVSTVTGDPVHPNDLCFGPDGMLYVTDPSRNPERNDGRLWRVDVATGETDFLGSTAWYPNGIGFRDGDDAVFVAQGAEGRILRIGFNAEGKLEKPELFVQLDHGRPDGFAWDTEGNLIIGCITGTAPGDLQVYDREGTLIDVVKPGSGQKYTNLALSSDKKLIVTDSDNGQVLQADWPHAGQALYPFRKGQNS